MPNVVFRIIVFSSLKGETPKTLIEDIALVLNFCRSPCSLHRISLNKIDVHLDLRLGYKELAHDNESELVSS
jgi:hypothetical protein